MKLLEVKTKNPNVLNLTWILNNICTNACSYCEPVLYAGKNHHYDWHHAEKFIQEISKRYNKINLSLSGGEPTLSPFLLDLCKQVNGDIHITTNGASSVRKYEELSKYVCSWSFSWHPEFQQEGWIDKVSRIAELSSVTVRVMAPANKMTDVNNFLNLIKSKEHNFQYEIVKIQPRGNIDLNTMKYSKDDEQQLVSWNGYKSVYPKKEFLRIKKYTLPNLSVNQIGRDAEYIFDITDVSVLRDTFQKSYINSNDVIKHGFTNYQGWSCNIGLESMFVQFDGTIKRGNCLVGGTIGSIQNFEDIQWPARPIICTSNRCDCNTDIRITKKKPAEAGSAIFGDKV